MNYVIRRAPKTDVCEQLRLLAGAESNKRVKLQFQEKQKMGLRGGRPRRRPGDLCL